MVFRVLFPLLWLAFIAFWIVMARGGKTVAAREDTLFAGVALRAAGDRRRAARRARPSVPFPLRPLRARQSGTVTLGAALTAAGVAFAVWARLRLAGNWSSDVTLKRDHELIVDGPYALVRHPIYTGVLLALFGTALAIGEWRAPLAVVIAGVAWWRKLTIEEVVMRRQFGDVYDRYAARTRALIPFVFRGPTACGGGFRARHSAGPAASRRRTDCDGALAQNDGAP